MAKDANKSKSAKDEGGFWDTGDGGKLHQKHRPAELFDLASNGANLRELMEAAVLFLRGCSGCEAIGVRLADGEDYPYFIADGFPKEFIDLENSLFAHDEDGEPIRDADGRVVLECMCGNVVCERFDSRQPFFTERGAFWTSSTTELLNNTTESDRQGHTRNQCNKEGYESLALVPLRAGQDTFGLLQLNDRKRGRFSESRVSLFEDFGDALAISLAYRKAVSRWKASEKKVLAQQKKLKLLAGRVALSEERKRHRFAQELHDEICQSLVVIKAKLDSLHRSAGSAEAASTLGEVSEQLGQNIRDIMSLIFEISAPTLHELGFEAAVADMLKEWVESASAIKTYFSDDGCDKPLGEDVRIVLFRGVQELLDNVISHAGASEVSVSVRKRGSEIEVEVEDDGVGFDAERELSAFEEGDGLGLFSVRERLEQLGGNLAVKSAPGGGAKVTMTAPLAI